MAKDAGHDTVGTDQPSPTELTDFLRLLGVALCMCGEATTRVSAYLTDIAEAYGATGARFFVLPTGVFVRMPGGEAAGAGLGTGESARTAGADRASGFSQPVIDFAPASKARCGSIRSRRSTA